MVTRRKVQGWDVRHAPRQDGRRFVVTGASAGLGLALTRMLVDLGAEVTMAVRDIAKGEAAAASLPGRTHVARLDVSDLSSVRHFAKTCGDVDVLVNNAGVMGTPYTRSLDGHELQLATNHLGHFALTNLLLPRLADRVVVLGSEAHRGGVIDVDDLSFQRRPYDAYGAYAQSKLATLLFLAELQRRLTAAGTTLRATGAHPGYTATAIMRQTGSRAFNALAGVGNRVAGMAVERGVLPVLFAATMDVPGNTYLGPHGPLELRGKPVPVGRSEAAASPDLAKALWRRSEELTGTAFPLGDVTPS
jgi:NAD(P)-dependent dehydrogenase (short-subunit alcohol dehydrogenase family)